MICVGGMIINAKQLYTVKNGKDVYYGIFIHIALDAEWVTKDEVCLVCKHKNGDQ